MKIVFMGTPDFSAVVLEKLNSAYPVSAVVTGLDKPVGRGYQLKPSPLKVKAEELGIPVLQYEKVSREGIEDIKALEPDVIVTAAFGQILSDAFLQIPKFAVLNVHASLLPKYRGSSPIQWAVLNGDEETGITIMKTVKAVDAGDILLQKKTKIGEKETAGELFDRLAILGGEAIVEALGLVESGNAHFVKQNESEVSHCSMIQKEDGKISFDKTARCLDCFVRGMNPWPSAYTEYDGKKFKVFEVQKVDDSTSHKIGEVVFADTRNGLVVQANDGLLRLADIQLEGAKRMSDVDFLRGRKIELGYLFE
ncbi:MAG: methionyl-tRNA formyltransferase [Clostridia bacterium]|nr:methionyl-tRNA formyltransferase [Clostridia bacterium]